MIKLKAQILALLEEKEMLILDSAPSAEIDAIDSELHALMEENS